MIALHAAGAAQSDAPMCEVNLGLGQIEFQFLRGQHDAHVPQALFGEWLCVPRHARRHLVAAKSRQIEIPLLVKRHFDVLGPLRGNTTCPASTRARRKFTPNSGSASTWRKAKCQLRQPGMPAPGAAFRRKVPCVS